MLTVSRQLWLVAGREQLFRIFEESTAMADARGRPTLRAVKVPLPAAPDSQPLLECLSAAVDTPMDLLPPISTALLHDNLQSAVCHLMILQAETEKTRISAIMVKTD